VTRIVEAAFESEIAVLSSGSILPLRSVPENIRQSSKFRRIAQSIAEVGVIEPIVVARVRGEKDKYMLLDGHVRFAILTENGEAQISCLVANDDEAFTYNKRVNRLATVQEHYMILRALNRGVSEEKLAKALNVDVAHLKRRRTLLDGICPEAVELLKDKSINPATFEVLRKMKPYRQIEAADLMVAAGNYTSSYAKALLVGTKQEDLARPEQPKKIIGMSAEQIDRMEREMAVLTSDFKSVESSYGDDVLHLVIASGYLNRLITNRAIEKYLRQHHPELLSEFRAIVSAASLDQAAQAS